MGAEEFLDNSLGILIPKEHAKLMELKIDWEVQGRPTAHPFIFGIIEAYHKVKVESITDEEISEQVTDHLFDSPYKRQCKEYARIGVVQFKNKLLNK